MWMNRRQKEILQSQLDDEQEVLEKLQGIYKKALEDIDDNISKLMGRTDTENLQSIVYQLNYQKALKTQINGILDNLASEQYTTISDYLANCYENGFLGTMYDLHGQGIPLIFPIDQDLVVRAIQNEAPLVESFYDYLGEDVNLLKKRVTNNISRGMAQGSSYAEIAKNITRGMIGDYTKVRGGAMYDAYRIARTEGHRITNAATYDAQTKAKEKGADVVKQWDATMDRRTRPHHQMLDGQIREIDEPFEIDGHKAMYPGSFGVAAEDINCRCASLQRAKWALTEDELQTLKDRAEYFGLDKTKDFDDFKRKYLDVSENATYNDIVTNAKSIRLEDVNNAISGGTIDESVSTEIIDVLKKHHSTFLFNGVEKSNLGDLIVFQTDPKKAGTFFDTVLVLNEDVLGGKSVAEIDAMFKAAKGTIANSLEDAIVHEMYHAKLIYGLNYAQLESLYDELSGIHIEGISKTAFIDGSECIAEMGVLIERGEKDKIPEDALKLFERYMGLT